MIRKRLWIASDKVFDRVTRGSYRKGAEITSYVEAALAGPIGIPAIHTYYLTYHNAYLVAYDKWNSHEGAQKSSTSALVSRLKDLVTAAKSWDLAIQRVYAEGSPEYIALLPHGRKPFYNGSQNDRIRAVKALSMAIGADALLANVKTEVDDFYTAIIANNAAQKGQITQSKSLSDDVETARVAMCTGLQYVKSALEQHYVDNPDMVINYFPMHLIQKVKQKEFTGRLAPLALRDLVKRSYSSTDIIDITNNGQDNLEAYKSNNKNGILPPGAIPVVVAPNTKERIAASQLGNLDYPYLIVRNPSTDKEGVFVVEA